MNLFELDLYEVIALLLDYAQFLQALLYGT